MKFSKPKIISIEIIWNTYLLPKMMQILVKSNKTASSGEQSLTKLGWNQLPPKNLNPKLVLVNLRNILRLDSDLNPNVIYPFWHNLWEWWSKWWKRLLSGSFFVKTQVDEIKFRFTKMISAVVGLPALPPKLSIFLKVFFHILHVVYSDLIPFYMVLNFL